MGTRQRNASKAAQQEQLGTPLKNGGKTSRSVTPNKTGVSAEMADCKLGLSDKPQKAKGKGGK
jgi:hypothetical protein